MLYFSSTENSPAPGPDGEPDVYKRVERGDGVGWCPTSTAEVPTGYSSNLGIEISSHCFDLGSMHSGETSTRIGDFFANLIVLGSKPRQPLCVLARLVEHGLTTSSPTFSSDWGIFQMW
jgi:hypothetical protein